MRVRKEAKPPNRAISESSECSEKGSERHGLCACLLREKDSFRSLFIASNAAGEAGGLEKRMVRAQGLPSRPETKPGASDCFYLGASDCFYLLPWTRARKFRSAISYFGTDFPAVTVVGR